MQQIITKIYRITNILTILILTILILYHTVHCFSNTTNAWWAMASFYSLIILVPLTISYTVFYFFWLKYNLVFYIFILIDILTFLLFLKLSINPYEFYKQRLIFISLVILTFTTAIDSFLKLYFKN